MTKETVEVDRAVLEALMSVAISWSEGGPDGDVHSCIVCGYEAFGHWDHWDHDKHHSKDCGLPRLIEKLK